MELDSNKAVVWFMLQDMWEQCLEKFHSSASIKPRTFQIIMQFMLLTFGFDIDIELWELEEVNHLDKGDILNTRWIKLITRCCIVPHQLRKDIPDRIPCIQTGYLALRSWPHLIYLPWPSMIYNIIIPSIIICFHLSFASTQAEPPMGHIISSFPSDLSLSTHVINLSLILWPLSLWRKGMECSGKKRQWEYWEETRCHWYQQKCHSGKTVFKTWFGSV